MRKIILLSVLFILGNLLFLPSCSDPKPTKGSLIITVMRYDGMTLGGEMVYLSKTYQDLENRIHIDSGWTDVNGQIWFHQKDPGYYWYDTKTWEDYGAAKVLNGIDLYVILWVNTLDTIH